MNEKKNEIILFENQGVKLEVNLKDWNGVANTKANGRVVWKR